MLSGRSHQSEVGRPALDHQGGGDAEQIERIACGDTAPHGDDIALGGTRGDGDLEPHRARAVVLNVFCLDHVHFVGSVLEHARALHHNGLLRT